MKVCLNCLGLEKWPRLEGMASAADTTEFPLVQGERTSPGMTSDGAVVACPGMAQPTARLSPPLPSFWMRFNVIFLAGDQIDRCRLLGGVDIPNLGIGPAGHRGDQAGVGRTGIGAQPQRAVVVARNPEHIAAGKRRGDESTDSRAIIVRPIDRPTKLGSRALPLGLFG